MADNTPQRAPRVIGLSASLRNARFSAGSESLVRDINALSSREELDEYLADQARICLEDFVAAGRADGLQFDEIYKKLQLRKGDRGLSNSEIALAAGLWGAKNQGCEIEHCGLARYFPPDKEPRNTDELKDRLRAAEGILLSGPVYFGDRGSVAQSFLEMIREDPQLQADLRGRVYAGISVGAKRNGGQETTLIYQMLDMCNLGLLAVGNDAGTTSQYGGTCVAGDVGTMASDTYGINTSVGTGNRFGQVVRMRCTPQSYKLKRKLKVTVWLLQDRDGIARGRIESQLAELDREDVEVTLRDFTERSIRRCIACDICPTHIDVDQEYRCIIKSKGDLFVQEHTSLIDADAVLIAGLSERDHGHVHSVYQRFIERTRYLRRGDYVLSNVMAAPWVIEEVGARENLWLRMMTSMLRHNTIMFRPLIEHLYEGRPLNADDVQSELREFVDHARAYTIAELHTTLQRDRESPLYNPVGYVLSVDREQESVRMQKRTATVKHREELRRAQARELLGEAG